MKFTAAVTFALLAAAAVRADFTTNMVARWTFNDAKDESKALTDDVGGLKLIRQAIGQDTAFKLNSDGTVALGGGVILLCREINTQTEKFSGLRSTVTIWARVRYTQNPKISPIFTMGLLNAVKPANWDQMTFTAFYKPEGLGIYGIGKGPKNTIGMSSGFLPYAKDGFSRIAITFSGERKEMLIWVDGQSAVRKKKELTELADFQGLAIGRLKEGAGQSMIVDELRIYSCTLSPEWLDEIEAVK